MKATLHCDMNIWMETAEGPLLGRGRMRLLELVNEKGSLKQAAAAMGMSYRAAWGKIKESEAAWGAPLLEKQGSNRRGFQLNPRGLELLTLYRDWLEDVKAYAGKTAQKCFEKYFEVEMLPENTLHHGDIRHTRKRRARS
ncbi:MAG: LysR family transcriptional regulator [Desulfovibrio sp.]|nr:LysR family transcriptional regulator [Desulfovibrio sp.]